MAKVKIPAEISRRMLWEDIEPESPNFSEIISDEITGKSRWADEHTVIFKTKTGFLRGQYRRGSTESQEEQPWEFETDVEFTEVEPYERTITDYRPITEKP